jgi:hypothetical protein
MPEATDGAVPQVQLPVNPLAVVGVALGIEVV